VPVDGYWQLSALANVASIIVMTSGVISSVITIKLISRNENWHSAKPYDSWRNRNVKVISNMVLSWLAAASVNGEMRTSCRETAIGWRRYHWYRGCVAYWL